MSERTIKLSAFDIAKACSKNFNAVVVGKKHTGKSTVIKDILHHAHKHKVPRFCVFSGTEESNGFYREFIPDLFIFDDNNVEGKLKEIVESQKKIAMKKKMGEIDESLDSRILIVLDDVGYKKNTLKCETLRQIFMNGRHHQISLIVACQYCMDLGIDLRTNADYVYVLKQNNISSVKNLHETYFGTFDKKKIFRPFLTRAHKTTSVSYSTTPNQVPLQAKCVSGTRQSLEKPSRSEAPKCGNTTIDGTLPINRDSNTKQKGHVHHRRRQRNRLQTLSFKSPPNQYIRRAMRRPFS